MTSVTSFRTAVTLQMFCRSAQMAANNRRRIWCWTPSVIASL
jgi:hypothetical protein